MLFASRAILFSRLQVTTTTRIRIKEELRERKGTMVTDPNTITTPAMGTIGAMIRMLISAVIMKEVLSLEVKVVVVVDLIMEVMLAAKEEVKVVVAVGVVEEGRGVVRTPR